MMRSEDGLAQSNGSAAGNDFIAAYNRACREDRSRKNVWTGSMIAAGATIVTPDDGWVDRNQHSVSPPHYASYNVPTPIGGLIALGTYRRWRLVRVLRIELSRYHGYPTYFFDPLSVMQGKQGCRAH